MNPHRRATLHDVAQYFGLAIEYAGDLPSGFHGCLEPGGDPRFIVINSNHSHPTAGADFGGGRWPG